MIIWTAWIFIQPPLQNGDDKAVASAPAVRSFRTPAISRSWRTRLLACAICRTPPAALVVLKARTNSPTPAASMSESRDKSSRIRRSPQLRSARIRWLSSEFTGTRSVPSTSRIERCAHCSRGSVIDCSWFVTWATIDHGFGTDLFDDSLGRDASNQPVAVSVHLGQELLARDVNRRDTRQVEHNSRVWLIEGRGRPVSRQFADPRSSESTVKSKGDRGRVSLHGNHEHGGHLVGLRGESDSPLASRSKVDKTSPTGPFPRHRS